MKKRRGRYLVPMLLVFCFPAGLIYMWTERCRWSRSVKSVISLAFAAALVALVLPQTQLPARPVGGVKLVGAAERQVRVLGPEAPADMDDIEIYTPRGDIAPLETQRPSDSIIIYISLDSAHYHVSGCTGMAGEETGVYLSVARDAGYTRCPDCNPPDDA